MKSCISLFIKCTCFRCAQLKYLDLTSSYEYTDVGVDAIVRNCSKLELTDFSYNDKITAEIFRKVPLEFLPRIKLVNLYKCYKVNFEKIQIIFFISCFFSF